MRPGTAIAPVPLRARLIRVVGTRFWLRIIWGTGARCGEWPYHRARRLIGAVPETKTDDLAWPKRVADWPNPADWPNRCETCGLAVPRGYHLNDDWYYVLRKPDGGTEIGPAHTDADWNRIVCDGDGNRQHAPGVPLYLVDSEWFYDTASGQPERGDLWWSEHEGQCDWTNCPGRHLVGNCPDGHHWDVDSRASNCSLPDDHTHRCWVIQGTPPDVTVGKAGPTCSAGAGSIQTYSRSPNGQQVGSWHGFLDGGWWVVRRGDHGLASQARLNVPPVYVPLAQPLAPGEEAPALADTTAPAPAETAAPAPAPAAEPAPVPAPPATKEDAMARILHLFHHPETAKDHNHLFREIGQALEHLFQML